MRYLYNIIFYLSLPFIVLRLLWKGCRARGYFSGWGERFGYYSGEPLCDTIWIHAVSLGESRAAIPLIKELLRLYPNQRVVVTNMTPTGSVSIRNSFGDSVVQLYVPYDYPGAVKRFLRHFQPRILLIMETELWPNILFYCKRYDVPVCLVNARLTEKSVTRYKKIAKFTKKILDCFARVIAQSARDGAWFRELGVEEAKLLVTGNIKFDINIADSVRTRAELLRKLWGTERMVWLAASTHSGEEEQVLTAFSTVLAHVANVLLILVPRHPERFDEVFSLCKQRGFNVVRYTDCNKQLCPADVNIILGDVMGQMQVLYAVADLAFVGGSLVPIGGHNVLEPAALAVPAMAGPYLQNVAEISQLLLDAGGMVKVHDAQELAEKSVAFLHDAELRQQYGKAALAVVEQNRGVTGKILEVVKELI